MTNTTQKHSPAQANRIMFAVTTLMWFSIYSYQSNFTPYLESLRISETMIGLILGSYGFTQMILRIPIGILSDKLKTRKLFIIIGIVFTFLSALLLFVTDNVILILIARASAGIAASTWVNFTVLFSSYFDANKSVGSLGYMNFFSNIGQIGAMIAGAVLISAVTGIFNNGTTYYNSAFLLAIVIGIISFVLSFKIYEDRGKIAASIKQTITVRQIFALFTDKTLISVSIIGAISQLITFGTLLGFTPKYAVDVLNTNALQNGVMMVLAYLPTAFGALFLSKYLAEKVKEHILVSVGMILMSVFTIVIPLISSYTLLVITQVFAGIGKGISFPLLMGLSIKKMPEEKRGTAMGIFQAVYGLGMFMGPLLMGIISDMFEFSLSFVILGGVCFITAVISYFLLKKLKL